MLFSVYARDFFRKVHMGGQNGIFEFCWGARFVHCIQ